MKRFNNPGTARRAAFTIIELMIAMAATLLIMGALTRAFGLVGNSIRDSRMKVLLSGQTRDLMFGIRTELGAITASNDPNAPDTGSGYLMIQEGPMADATTTTFYGTGTTGVTPGYFPLSRWGDTDDYIAYTVKAPKDAPFIGVVPWGVLEAAKCAALTAAGSSYSRPASYVPAEPRVIQSQLAEVCYFMAPRMVRDASGALQYESDDGDATDGMLEDGIPQYLDVDGDDYPDEFVMYRRILLIRPDLNVTASQLGSIAVGFGGNLLPEQPVIGYLGTTAGPLQVQPAGATVASLNPGVWGATPTTTTPNWLIGMARVQQRMDLSVAREFLHDTNTGLSTGVPSSFFSASSLEALRSPHRRFAHVMMPPSTPSTLLMSGGRASMPLLALAPPLKFLAKGPTAPVTTTSLPVTDDDDPSTPNQADRFTMTGHLRPEFILGGAREGEDIVGTNIAGFDVRVFDPGAPLFVVPGSDGLPGVGATDDNGDGSIDNVSELGSINSDDQVVSANDPYIYVASRDTVAPPLPPAAAPMPPQLVSLGAFVDIGYAQQAGGNLRLGISDGTLGTIDERFFDAIDSSFSGVELIPATSPKSMRVAQGFRFSGKFVRRLNAFSFVQPTFDSWTTEYESDNINQAQWIDSGYEFNGLDAFNSHYWIFNAAGAMPAPNVSDGNGGIDLPDPGTNQTSVFLGGFAFSDVQPPIRAPLKAVKITVRNYDQGTRQFGQLEVVHQFD